VPLPRMGFATRFAARVGGKQIPEFVNSGICFAGNDVGKRASDADALEVFQGRSSTQPARFLLTSDKIKADRAGFRAIKEVGADGFLNVSSQFLPSVSLRKNVLRQTLGHEAAVALQGDLENEFAHRC